MYRAARPEQRAGVAGMYLSLALTSFLTGVTEPIEFSFMFVAPVLYALHALLTGAAMALMSLLDVHLGFGFSAGLLDYVLNYGRATHPLRLIPVGLAYAVIYYGIFSFAIRRFDLKTPGRSPEADGAPIHDGGISDRAPLFVTALGGANNLNRVEACTTRLRIQIADSALVDEAALGKLGARGVIRPGPGSLQVVLGPVADQIAGEINAVLGGRREAKPAEVPPQDVVPDGPASIDARLLGMLGGAGNIEDVHRTRDRTLITLRSPVAVAPRIEGIPDVRAIAMIDPLHAHLLLNPAR
jgi:PTS system N-acetylglucosamine-specific IIC component